MIVLIVFVGKYLWLAGPLLWLMAAARAPRARRLALGRWLLFSLPLTHLLSRLAGHFYYSTRPFVAGQFAPLIAHAADNGFPSDHTLLLAALAAAASFLGARNGFDRRVTIALWLITALVGWARVAAGLHHWIDIIGAIATALVSAAAVNFCIKKER